MSRFSLGSTQAGLFFSSLYAGGVPVTARAECDAVRAAWRIGGCDKRIPLTAVGRCRKVHASR